MSKRAFHATNYTPTAQADGGALTSGTYQALKAGVSTLLQVIEVMIEGLAGASAPTIMQLARASTLETTPTALASPNSDGFMNPLSSALSVTSTAFVAAATGPQRSSTTTDAKLDLNLNAFGGIVRWQAAPGEEWWIHGASTVAAPAGESILSAFTGGTVGAVSSHLIYEPL
jgi:hypothetical protein